MQLTDLLAPHASRLKAIPLAQLNSNDPARARDFALQANDLYLNFARQRWDREALEALFDIATARDVSAQLKDLFDGKEVNRTEKRAALHTALRSNISNAPAARESNQLANATFERMSEIVERLSRPDIHDVVSLGIGGSDLGPRFVVDAFGSQTPTRVHFVSNADAHAVDRCLAALDPAHTAVIVMSKSFGTQETLLNAGVARAWLGEYANDRIYAVTSRPEAAIEFGVAPAHVLPMWDWVGGRYSLWSAVGLPIALALGMSGFKSLLDGAAKTDALVYSAPLRENPAVWHALSVVWNTNALGLAGHVVVPYDERLRLLPAYLQQLVMESLGKSTRFDGQKIVDATSPVWWGSAGTDAQHSYFQCLHQGNATSNIELIGVVHPDHSHDDQHKVVLANLFAQSEALANGHAATDPHLAHAGDRPNTLILISRLNPDSLGQLLALYEHSVFVQSVMWGINAFDQFGVELGKHLAAGLLRTWDDGAAAHDPVTRALMDEIGRE